MNSNVVISREGNGASPNTSGSDCREMLMASRVQVRNRFRMGPESELHLCSRNRPLAGFFTTWQKQTASFLLSLPENVPPAPSSILSARRDLQAKAVRAPQGQVSERKGKDARAHASRMRSVRQGPHHGNCGHVPGAFGEAVLSLCHASVSKDMDLQGKKSKPPNAHRLLPLRRA